MQGTIRVFAVLGVAVFSSASIFLFPLHAGEGADESSGANEPPGHLAALLEGLDSPDYRARRSSADRLSELLESEGQRSAVEQYFKQSAGSHDSFDVRQRLAALGLSPQPPRATKDSLSMPATNEDVASLVRQLESDRYRERAGAIEALERAARTHRSIDWFYPTLKESASESRTAEVRVTLARLLHTARFTWLNSAADQQVLPHSADQINGLIRLLTSEADSPTKATTGPLRLKASARRDTAEWELLDALARQNTTEGVRQALGAALDREGLDDDARKRLRRLDEWSRPGLAVEYWQRRQNLAIQFFVVGMPSQAPGALRPTRFDRLGTDFAVCGSGNALEPGEYPLSVAFPHPREQAAFFQLVPLATARERLIYQHEVESLADSDRLRAITDRTLGPALVRKRPMDDAQLWLLGQLDQPTVARMLQVYFAEVQDEPFDLSLLAPMLTDVSSVHRTACLMLALDGSHDVVPVLVEAAEHKRFLSLSTDEPQAMPWIAALAIAAREPWAEVDWWLAGLVEVTDRISFGHGQQGDVGATAAAMLLVRNGEQLGDFGLVARESMRRGLHDRFEAPVNADYRRRMFEDRMLKQLGLTPHYFVSNDGRADVQAWWARRQALRTSPAPKALFPSPAAFTVRAARP